jgi:hypothetical protein
VYSAAYRGAVERFLAGPFAEGRLEERLREAHELVGPHVVGGEGEQPGYTMLRDPEAFEGSLEELEAHVVSRRAAAADALAGL